MGRKSIAWFLEENIDKHDLVKVRITPKVANYRVGAKVYYPGDIVEVPEFAISESFMARVVTVEEHTPAIVEEPTEEPVEEKPPVKKKRRRKKVTKPEPVAEPEDVDTTEASD